MRRQDALARQQEAVRGHLLSIHDCIIADMHAAGWHHHGPALQIARSVAAYQHQIMTRAITEQFRSLVSDRPSFPSFEAWKGGAVPGDVPTHIPAILTAPAYDSGALPVDLPGYRRVVTERGWHHLDALGKIAIRDLGDIILVDKAGDDQAVRMALHLAQAKWGTVAILSGDKSFHAQCRRIAAQEGIALQGQKQSGKQAEAAPAVQRLSTGAAAKPTPNATQPPMESASPYGAFPILFDLPPAQETHNGISSFDGLDPLIDAWLSLHRRDAQDFARLRALAARIMQDRPARQILLQMEAEGQPEAQRIKQQANFQQQRGREGLMLAEQKR